MSNVREGVIGVMCMVPNDVRRVGKIPLSADV